MSFEGVKRIVGLPNDKATLENGMKYNKCFVAGTSMTRFITDGIDYSFDREKRLEITFNIIKGAKPSKVKLIRV